MGYTFVEKALARSAGLEYTRAGQMVDARPNVILSHDNTAAIAKLFRSLGVDRVRFPERLVVTLDHAVPAPTAEHARNHAEVRRFVTEQGVQHFFEAGRGICHQVASEEALVLPGQLILGADSHTTHFGWLGALGAGVGRSEIAALWATGELWLKVPDTIRIDLVGTLPPGGGVTTKDLSLWLLSMLGPEAGIYRSLEFGGEGLGHLSLDSRAVIPNMMAESGVKNAYLEPDEEVFAWLAHRLGERTGTSETACREEIEAGALYADDDASYLAHYTLDLSVLGPAIALPGSPSNVTPLSQAAGARIHQAFIGTCTNGRLEDLAAAAAVLRGSGGEIMRIAEGTRLIVIPASRQVFEQALAAGYIQTFVAAGAMLGTPGCGPCMGNHFGIPASGEVVLSSANRNFRGRMGNPESAVYLASPAVVAASALTGRITDPRELADGLLPPLHLDTVYFPAGVPRLEPVQESTLRVSAKTLFTPASDEISADVPGAGVLAAGLPSHAPMFLEGRAWRYGDDVSTDEIFPGKYTYTVDQTSELKRHALEDLDPAFADAVAPGDIIVAGRNWGRGSSREQAVTCLLAAGVRAVVAESFARIYYRNAINNGLVPIVCPGAAAAIRSGDAITIDLDGHVVSTASGRYAFPPFSESARRLMEAGGLLAMLAKQNSAAGKCTRFGESCKASQPQESTLCLKGPEVAIAPAHPSQ